MEFRPWNLTYEIKLGGFVKFERKISRYANNFNIYHFKQILKININLPFE